MKTIDSLVAELAERDRRIAAMEAIVAAARKVAEDAGWRERHWCAAYGELDRALAAYDAAVQVNREHDSYL